MEVNNKDIVNLSNSILKYFNLDTYHDSLKELDDILSKNNYKNIVCLLCDGLGSYNLKDNLKKDSFFRKNKICDIKSVFPPTTTAATTSFFTGKYPSSHNWYGWDVYFKDTDEVISLFLNKNKKTGNLPKLNVLDRPYMKYKSIVDLINDNTDYDAYYAYPFTKDNPCYNLDEVINRILDLTNKPNKKFIYGYIENPDSTLHEYGCYSKTSKFVIQEINDKIEILSSKLKNTLLIIFADHGLTNVKNINLERDYKEIYDLIDYTAIEPRALGVKLKDITNKDKFLELFNKYLKDKFIIFTQDEVINNKLFGLDDNIYLRDTIGDYLIIATSNYSLNYDSSYPNFKASHAGLTKKELTIPLIIVECK